MILQQVQSFADGSWANQVWDECFAYFIKEKDTSFVFTDVM